MKRSLALVFTAVATFALAPITRGAEKIDVTDCYSGTAASFHTDKSVTPVYSWTQNGILSSHGKGVRDNFTK